MSFLIYCIMAVIGLAIGSFLNVVIYRLPIMLQQRWRDQCHDLLGQPTSTSAHLFLSTPPSFCPRCHAPLSWRDNIPVWSFIALKGACRHCQQRIHWRYPLVEITTSLLSVLILQQWGLTLDALSLMGLSYALVVLFVIDWQHHLLPDVLTLPLVWTGLIINTQQVWTTSEEAVLAAALGYVILLSTAKLYQKLRRQEGLGLGDCKLLAVFGAWFGGSIMLNTLLTSTLLGSAVGIGLLLCKKIPSNQPIPFGPFLILSGWLSLTFGPFMLHWLHP